MAYVKPPSEIFAEANLIDTVKERAEFLRAHMRPSIRILLACVFNPKIVFPDFSDVKWKRLNNQRGITDTNIDKECRRIYVLCDEVNIPFERKKAKLIQMLEGMHVDDSELLFNWILKKKLPASKITSSFIIKSFPELFVLNISPVVYGR